jgi:hypothetical protein
MQLISSIKNIIMLSPSRIGKIFFKCIISNIDNVVSVKFYPTGKWVDPFIPPHEIFVGGDKFHHQERWHQTGMAIGSLEHFLTANNHVFTVSDIINEEYVEVTINV